MRKLTGTIFSDTVKRKNEVMKCKTNSNSDSLPLIVKLPLDIAFMALLACLKTKDFLIKTLHRFG